MRYMHKRIYFNKFELQELERRNPTLFELAKHVADKAHITAKVNGDDWIAVEKRGGSGYGKLMCPSEVFHVPGTELNELDPACDELCCWAIHDEPSEKPYRPCWFRRWNDFVSDMRGV